MKTKMDIIEPNGLYDTRTVDLPKNPGFDLLQKLIMTYLAGAENFEHVTVLHRGKRRDMFVDEMGAMKPLQCQRNEKATAIYRNNWLTQHPDTNPEDIAAIYGTAVLFPERQVWF